MTAWGSGLGISTAVHPLITHRFMTAVKPAMWKKGKIASSLSWLSLISKNHSLAICVIAETFRWVMATPFARPVVPPE
jgi:hypothetical protein